MTTWAAVTALIRGVPDLPGARCRGQAELFEAAIGRRISEPSREAQAKRRTEVENARAVALGLCHSCPSLVACRAWVDGMRPTRRPPGVVGGRVITANGLPAKTWAPAEASG